MITRELEASLVYADEATIAFMDLRQPNGGHVLVVPRPHIQTLYDLDEATGAALMRTIVPTARAVRKTLRPAGMSIWQSNGEAIGQEVPHLHFHVLARQPADGLLRVFRTRATSPLTAGEPIVLNIDSATGAASLIAVSSSRCTVDTGGQVSSTWSVRGWNTMSAPATITVEATEDTARRDALVGRIFQAALGMMDLVALYIGDRLNLYRALADFGPATPGELAARTGLVERYVREWLEQQAVTGLLDVDQATGEPQGRRYRLSSGYAAALLDPDNLAYLPPLARQLVGAVRPLPALLTAFRAGGGVPYADYGPDMHEGIAAANRVLFLNLLGAAWLPALPDLHARLQAEPPARVADIGCGSGWSSIALARAYPMVRVDGFDLDGPSIAHAQANVAAAGLADRVTMQVRDATDPALAGRYDLVTAFECIHDMAQPVEALRSMRRIVRPDGVALVVDERVAETFTAPGDEVERLMYGFSVLHCLPVGLADTPSAGTGTVMRPDTLRRYATAAGFGAVEVLPIAHDLWRFYRLTP